MSKPRRSSFSFPNLLLSCLNLTLFILSAASIAPTLLLRTPPTSLGAAILLVSLSTLAAAFVGFYSYLAGCCFLTHIALLLASLLGQVLVVLALFLRERSSLSMLKSPRDLREAKLLVRAECGVMMAMLLVEVVVLVISCCVQVCWVREYESMEAEREMAARRRSRRVAQVQEEAMANAAKIAEVKSKEFDEKMRNKYGQAWVKTDFEG